MDQQVRKAKTTHYLRTALIDLMQEKSIHSITVKELCAKAQINRATFYGHYQNKENFLNQIIETVNAEMTLVIDDKNRYNVLLNNENPTEAYRSGIQYVLDNADIFRAMFGPHGLGGFQDILVRQGVEQLAEALRPFEPRFEDKVELDVLANFIINAELGSLNHYVRTNMKYSAHYMAEQLLTMIAGILVTLDIPVPLAKFNHE